MSNRIAKMRRRLNDKKWLEAKLEIVQEEVKRWSNFYSFQCSSFFGSSERLVQYNKSKYEKGSRKAYNRLNFILSHLNKRP